MAHAAGASDLSDDGGDIESPSTSIGAREKVGAVEDSAAPVTVKESDPDDVIEPLIQLEFKKLQQAALRWKGLRSSGDGARTLSAVKFEKVPPNCRTLTDRFPS